MKRERYAAAAAPCYIRALDEDRDERREGYGLWLMRKVMNDSRSCGLRKCVCVCVCDCEGGVDR